LLLHTWLRLPCPSQYTLTVVVVLVVVVPSIVDVDVLGSCTKTLTGAVRGMKRVMAGRLRSGGTRTATP
jgi:hypothetical protein